MLSLFATHAFIIAVHADRSVLDALRVTSGSRVARVASDEAWIIGDRSVRSQTSTEAVGQVGPPLSDGLVVDQTDGWSIWSVRGPEVRQVLGRLMVADLPSGGYGFVQGAIAGVSGKLLLLGDTAHLMVPAPVGHHLRDRIVAVSGDLGLEFEESRPFA